MGSYVSKKKGFVPAEPSAVTVDFAQDVKITAVCGTIVAANKPIKPEEDSAEEYLWKIANPHSSDFVQDQIDGFVYASTAYHQYIYLRKPRNQPNHRFESVGRVNIGNSVVSLGDCRTTSTSITRDVTRVQPEASSLKLHTLTCIFSPNGTEHYVCQGTSYIVTYF